MLEELPVVCAVFSRCKKSRDGAFEQNAEDSEHFFTEPFESREVSEHVND